MELSVHYVRTRCLFVKSDRYIRPTTSLLPSRDLSTRMEESRILTRYP